MSKILRKLTCLILAAACLAGGAACVKLPEVNNDFTFDPDTVDPATLTGTVSVWWAPMDYMWEPMERAIEKFNKQYPNATIDLIKKTRADYYDDLNLAFANGTAPDVVRLDHVYVQSLGESGRVLDLTKMTGGKVEINEEEQFIDQTWQAMRIGEHQYGFPLESNTTLFMYNETICEEVFGPDYTPPTTFEELCEQSLQVRAYEKDGENPYHGFIMPINASNSQHDMYVINGWMARFGASLLNDERTECTLNTPEAIEAFRTMQDAADSGAIEYTGYAPYLENQFIYDGTVAFIEMGSWIYNDVKGMDLNLDGESDIKVAAIPSTTEGIPGYATLGSSGLCINSTCKDENKIAAYEFIRFCATDYETHMDFAKEMKVFPSLEEGLEDPYYHEPNESDPNWVEYWDIFMDQLLISVPRPGTKFWPEITTKLKYAEYKLVDGGQSPEKVANDVTADINKLFR